MTQTIDQPAPVRELRARPSLEDPQRCADELDMAARHIFWSAARRDPRAFMSVRRHANPLIRRGQTVSRGVVTRFAGRRSTDRATQQALSALPARLDQIDAWIEDGLLNTTDITAADVQIASGVAFLMRFEDLAPYLEDRPAAELARRVAPIEPLTPEHHGRVITVLPPAWLAPLRAAG